MNDDRRKAAWEELNITRDELKSIGDALKNEEFRKLLGEYAEEISDPENKRIYEEEIKLLEKERGVDCTFIHPEPGYVIKTSVDGERKAFINVCWNNNIGKPTSTPSSNSAGTRGLTWSLPYTQAPPRDDLDKKNKRCSVFDVLFHPDTLHLAENNAHFRNMLNDTALDAVENNFHVKLDRKNLKFPKMNFKGSSHATVIRKKSSRPTSKTRDESNSSLAFPYPYEELNTDESNVKSPGSVTTAKPRPTKTQEKEKDDEYTTPRYTMKYRSSVDIQDFANDKDAKVNAAIPKELIVTIFLPLLNSTANVILDVNEKWIHLKSTQIAKYFLHLPLPYAINEELGNAKFDKSERKLVLTLPVKRTNKTVADLSREDSGVESDPGIRTPESEEDEKEDSVPNLITVISSSNDVENSERTMATVAKESFLNPDIHYSFPTFTCNVVDDVLAFTLHVKNVEPDSMKHNRLDNNGVHICFSSMGSGFFPLYYAFYVKLPSEFTIADNGISLETWDNNVITQLVLNPSDNLLTNYSVGTHEESATIQDLPEPTAIGQKLEHVESDDEAIDMDIQVTKNSDDKVVIEITPKEINNVVKNNFKHNAISPPTHQVQYPPKKHPQLDLEKARSYSESSSDEMHLSPTKRGILKCRSVSRSLSESNAEDYPCSSSLDAFQHSISSDSCIPEEPEEELGSKKTVRFNEVITRKTFRTNSSILGQRKKNQRKLRNKKRAQERRASESENSEGESDKVKQKDKSTKKVAEDSEDANSSNDKTSSSGGSGDEAGDATNGADTSEQPDHSEVAIVQKQDKSVPIKHLNKCKKNSKRVRKPKSVEAQQLGFKNDMIFDLDM